MVLPLNEGKINIRLELVSYQTRKMRWDKLDENDNRIVETQGWISLENYRELENRSGVYLFVDTWDDVKYVGKAGPRRMVDEVADAISRGKDRNASKVGTLYTNSDANALSLERDLRRKYRPPNNIL